MVYSNFLGGILMIFSLIFNSFTSWAVSIQNVLIEENFFIKDIFPVLFTSLLVYKITRTVETKDYKRRSAESTISELDKIVSSLSFAQAQFVNYTTLLPQTQSLDLCTGRTLTNGDIELLISHHASFKKNLDSLYITYVRVNMFGFSKKAKEDLIYLNEYYRKTDEIFTEFLDKLLENIKENFIDEEYIKEFRSIHDKHIDESLFSHKFNSLIANISTPYMRISFFERISIEKKVKRIMDEINNHDDKSTNK